MRISPTLFGYVLRIYLARVLIIFMILSGLFAIIDLLELLRRSSGKIDINFHIILQMNLLKLPALFQEMLPFVLLFAAMFTFWHLVRSVQLLVFFASGVSVWQFLLPILLCALVIGTLQITLFNPMAATFRGEYERLENRHLKNRENRLNIFKKDLWLRQGDANGQQIIHAKRALEMGMILEEVSVFVLTEKQGFKSRLVAERAFLKPNFWLLEDVRLSEMDGSLKIIDRYSLPTNFTLDKIQESFTSPATLSFWDLPTFIQTLENAGFNADAHRLRFHSLLATPLLFCAMVLIAATFSLRYYRQVHTGYLILAGLGCGFLLYFLTNIVHALGLSTELPVILAAWTPSIVSALLGVSALLHLEDG